MSQFHLTFYDQQPDGMRSAGPIEVTADSAIEAFGLFDDRLLARSGQVGSLVGEVKHFAGAGKVTERVMFYFNA